MIKGDYQAPLLLLDDKLRARIVKSACKNEIGKVKNLIHWMKGAARLNSQKPADIHAHLVNWSGKDEVIQRKLLRIWFESHPGGLCEKSK